MVSNCAFSRIGGDDWDLHSPLGRRYVRGVYPVLDHSFPALGAGRLLKCRRPDLFAGELGAIWQGK